jgi:hypothetical protein
MLHDAIGYVAGIFVSQTKLRKQKLILTTQGTRLKQTTGDIHSATTNRESGRIQPTNTSVRQKPVALDRTQVKILCFANQSGTSADDAQLKNVITSMSVDPVP